MMLMVVRLLADPVPNASPSSAGLPAVSGLGTLFGWLMFGALLLCAAGGIMSGAAVGIGNATGRVDMALRGKTGLLWSMGGALIVGMAIPLVNTFYHLGAG